MASLRVVPAAAFPSGFQPGFVGCVNARAPHRKCKNLSKCARKLVEVSKMAVRKKKNTSLLVP